MVAPYRTRKQRQTSAEQVPLPARLRFEADSGDIDALTGPGGQIGAIGKRRCLRPGPDQRAIIAKPAEGGPDEASVPVEAAWSAGNPTCDVGIGHERAGTA